jgi:hypothetical protein
MKKKVLLALHGPVLLALQGSGLPASGAELTLKPSQSYADPRSAERKIQTAVEVGDDSGGLVAEYALRLYEMQQSRRKVEFVGRCDSACTLFLALPTEQTCITEGALFRFHAPSAPSASAEVAVASYMMRKYPQWVRAWLVAQGGLSDKLETMGYQYASRFIQTCSLARR